MTVTDVQRDYRLLFSFTLHPIEIAGPSVPSAFCNL
jgi:hypothetical protein